MFARLARWFHEQVALSPDLRHLDDGATRWRYGDDPDSDPHPDG